MLIVVMKGMSVLGALRKRPFHRCRSWTCRFLVALFFLVVRGQRNHAAGCDHTPVLAFAHGNGQGVEDSARLHDMQRPARS